MWQQEAPSRWVKRIVVAVAVLFVLAGCSSISESPDNVDLHPLVLYGEPDGDAHPHVGLVVFDVDGAPSHRCSGTLLSPTVLLTAGHCTAGTDTARVWFDAEIVDTKYPLGDGDAIEGTPDTFPGFDFANFPDAGDVGVVVLDDPVVLDTYGELADVGFLDALATKRGKQQTTFTIVGYGVQGTVPDFQADLERYRGTVMLVDLRSALTDGFNIQVSSNPGRGQSSGGLCFGDSGGPVFHGDSNTIVGVSSFVLNQHCVGAGFAYRADLETVDAFVGGFLD